MIDVMYECVYEEQYVEQPAFWYRKAAEQGHADAQENLTNRGINWKDA